MGFVVALGCPDSISDASDTSGFGGKCLGGVMRDDQPMTFTEFVRQSGEWGNLTEVQRELVMSVDDPNHIFVEAGRRCGKQYVFDLHKKWVDRCTNMVEDHRRLSI